MIFKIIYTALLFTLLSGIVYSADYIDPLTGYEFNLIEDVNGDKDIYIGVYEVTQGQWQKIMKSNSSYFKKGPEYPVENISYQNIIKFISTLNTQTGKNYRLPTLDEWLYVAKSNIQELSNISDNESCAIGNLYDLSSDKINRFGQRPFKCSDNFPYTAPIGSFAANEMGVYDMIGNVSEWVIDNSSGAQKTATAGFNCFDGAKDIKNISKNEPKSRKFGGLGFRLAFDPE